MTNKELNNALYEKMPAQQDEYRNWLLQQAPEEILNHTYEYTIREDIVMAMSYLDLTDDQAQALLASPSPLDDVFKVYDNFETTHMDTIRECIEDRAHTLIERQKEELRQLPVYPYSGTYAREHGELDTFRKSNRANEECRDAIDKAIRDHYDGSSLGVEAVREVVDKFGFDRTLYILANTVRHRDWDERFSRANREWAASYPAFNLPDAPAPDRTVYQALNSHSGLVDIFTSSARREFMLTQPLQPSDIEAEAKRILSKLQTLPEPNSPSGTHFMAEVSPDFLARASTRQQTELLKLLPFKTLTLSTLDNRKGIFAMVTSDEDRSKPLRRPSVRSRLDKSEAPPKPRATGKKKDMEL